MRALILAGILLLCASAPARAGTATLDLSGTIAWAAFEDLEGVPDDVRVVSPAVHTITFLGPTVVAGPGCVPVPGGASCTHPDMSDVWERTRIELGGGDDALVVEAPHPAVLAGGAGNDRITLGPAARATAAGMEGDDTLTALGSATLEGGPGNDVLSAGTRSGLSGGDGTDRLVGSPQNDVLVDAGDRGARDVIVCNGGADVTQGDETDALEGCSSSALDELSKTKFHWKVRFGPRLSVPTTMRVRYSEYYGDLQGPFARCVGAPCHGARLDIPRGARDWRIVSGGRRVRIKGRWWRGVSPGAKVQVGLEFSFGNVVFTKGWEFRTRARALPVKRKRCTVAIVKPPATRARATEVPCT